MRTSNSSFFFMCSLCYNTNSVGDIMLYKGTMFRVEDIDYEEEELEYFTGIVRIKKENGKNFENIDESNNSKISRSIGR